MKSVFVNYDYYSQIDASVLSILRQHGIGYRDRMLSEIICDMRTTGAPAVNLIPRLQNEITKIEELKSRRIKAKRFLKPWPCRGCGKEFQPKHRRQVYCRRCRLSRSSNDCIPDGVAKEMFRRHQLGVGL